MSDVPPQEVPTGLEALADVFVEKARAEPVEVVDLRGQHWLLAWRAEPEAQVAVHALDRRTALPALAEVTAHDLSALLAWGMEPRPRTPLQPISDRAWRLLGLDHPLAAAVRQSRADVLLLRAHGLPEGFAVEAARAGLSVFVPDARRPRGESLLPLVLWCWSGRGVWPPMRRAIPPGDLLLRVVAEAPPARAVEELSAALRRLARMPSSQAWSARELGELRAVLEPFGLPLPPVEIVDVDREGGVSVTWRADRLVAATPPLERMSVAELEGAAAMLDGFVPAHVRDAFQAAARQAEDDARALGASVEDGGILARDPRKPTTRRAVAVTSSEGRSGTVRGPSAFAGGHVAATPVEPIAAASPLTPPATPAAAAPSRDNGGQRPSPGIRAPSIAYTRREASLAEAEDGHGDAAGTTRANPRVGRRSDGGRDVGGGGDGPSGDGHWGDDDGADSIHRGAPSRDAEALAWQRSSLTPTATDAEPTSLREALAASRAAKIDSGNGAPRSLFSAAFRRSLAGRFAAGFRSLGGFATWVFFAGGVVGFGVGFLVGEHRATSDTAGAVAAARVDAVDDDLLVQASADPTGTAAEGIAAEDRAASDGDGSAGPEGAGTAGAGTDDLNDAAVAAVVKPSPPLPPGALRGEPIGHADEPAPNDGGGQPSKVPIGPGFATLDHVSLWDGTSAPWRDDGVKARCNVYGDLELEAKAGHKILICGVYYSQEGHLIRYGTCATGPARCVDIRRGRVGTLPYLCTPRSGRPLVRFRVKKGQTDRFTSDIAVRVHFDKWRKNPNEPMCGASAPYFSRIDSRWLDAGEPPTGEQPAGAQPGAVGAGAESGGD